MVNHLLRRYNTDAMTTGADKTIQNFKKRALKP